MKTPLLGLTIALLFAVAPTSNAADNNYLPTLMTDTAFEGRQLAIKLARKSIGEMQSDPAVKKRVRAQYSQSAPELIAAAQVIATEFQIIAAANNYWRE